MGSLYAILQVRKTPNFLASRANFHTTAILCETPYSTHYLESWEMQGWVGVALAKLKLFLIHASMEGSRTQGEERCLVPISGAQVSFYRHRLRLW